MPTDQETPASPGRQRLDIMKALIADAFAVGNTRCAQHFVDDKHKPGIEVAVYVGRGARSYVLVALYNKSWHDLTSFEIYLPADLGGSWVAQRRTPVAGQLPHGGSNEHGITREKLLTFLRGE